MMNFEVLQIVAVKDQKFFVYNLYTIFIKLCSNVSIVKHAKNESNINAL